MQHVQNFKINKLNLDKSKKYLTPEESFYILNSDVKNKSALDKAVPMAGNYAACEMESMPAGENYTVLTYYSAITNEAYNGVINSNGASFISRIKGDGVCEIVYQNEDCLNFSPAPRYAITQDRAHLIVEKSNCANRHGKYLMWVDGLNEQIFFLDVEAAIATNNFSTPFFDRCNTNPCDFINLCVPESCGCLQAEFLPLPDEEAGWTNHLVDVGIKLMYKFEYYDGRMSEWSDRSTLYYQDTKGCFDSSSGFSRCMKMTIPLGGPMVTRIHIAFNKSEFDESNNEIWYETEVVEKHKKYTSAQQYWYERELSESVLSNLTDDGCGFYYNFCNDKQCRVVDPLEVSRVYNPMPRYAQGLMPIKDAIGVYNYILGNCEVDKNQVDKLHIDTVCPTIIDCEPEIVTVTVRAIIYNDVYHRPQEIYRLGGDTPSIDDDETDTAYFGGLKNVTPTFPNETGFDQQFSGGTRNFIVYAEGTEAWTEMEQWHASKFFNNRTKTGVISGFTEVKVRAFISGDSDNDNFHYQEGYIKVRKGTRGFVRLASHKAEGNLQDTSTFVAGLIDIRDYAGRDHLTIANLSEEIYFDTCAGDVELFQAFVIKDNAITNTIAFNGYVTDKNARPVEGAIVVPYPDGSEDLADQCVTDHNGFYHLKVTSASASSMDLQVRVETSCGAFATLETATVQGAVGINTSHDIVIDSETWKNDFYSNVAIKVEDCDGQGIPGIRVALSGSKYDTTNNNGLATWKIRNYSTRNRSVKAVVLDYHGCFTTDCAGGCNPCMPTSTGVTEVCYITKPTLTLTTVVLNVANALLKSKGLKASGLYPFAFMIQGTCGTKISAAYELPAIRIPSTQEKEHLSFCAFTYDGTDMELPFDGCLKILRGENLNSYELQWIVDKIERTGDNKIKLTIQSLNDYNEKYFFKTNAVYQFLAGDRIEFIRNGDGKIFTTAKNGLLSYLTLSPFHDELVSGKADAPADFFNQLLIEDDGRLDSLTEGAVIELQRAKACTTEPAYKEICVTIPIVNGALLYPTGTFTTFDTYFVNRILTYQKDDKTVVLPPVTFEHHSPSDFWGDHLNDAGKVHFANKFENEKRWEDSISISAVTQYNYFGDLVKTFGKIGQGAITSAKNIDGRNIFFLCENYPFISQVADEFARVGSDGILRALPADSILSDASILAGQYGCQYESIGSVLYGDGFAFYADRNKGHYIIHDYQRAQIAGTDKEGTTMQSYTTKRFQEMAFLNSSQTDFYNHYRFASGYNKESKCVYITIKTLRQPAINNEKAPFIEKNDTLVYHPESDAFLTFHSSTPEGYSNLNLFDGFGCSMLSFYNSIPYVTPIIPDKFNVFFDLHCDWVIGVSINEKPTKLKIPLAYELQSSQMWFVPSGGVTSESNGFTSHVPPIRVKKIEKKYNAAFLNNENSRGGLFNGECARDYSISVLLMRDNTDNLIYNSIDNNKREKYGEIDLILVRYIFSEASGFPDAQ